VAHPGGGQRQPQSRRVTERSAGLQALAPRSSGLFVHPVRDCLAVLLACYLIRPVEQYDAFMYKTEGTPRWARTIVTYRPRLSRVFRQVLLLTRGGRLLVRHVVAEGPMRGEIPKSTSEKGISAGHVGDTASSRFR
jgi:hypothetical protein